MQMSWGTHMLDKIIAKLYGTIHEDKLLNEMNRLYDAAYVAGAKRERQEIMAILDRLNHDFCEVHNCTCRQAREEIAHRSGHVAPN